ncbi:MAG TPA: sugar phosphate isomerase/epimerase family protein [Verrucomicrobiae bacterium]|nr:sugar phosphate isomerase/epimerase family protein [Verrucomicrobiae bacterium]
MKLGFVSAILPELSLEEVLKFAADEGFDCVEVMCWPAGKAERKFAGITHIDVADFSPASADEVNALVRKYGVEISALGYYPNPLDPDDTAAKSVVEHLKKVIVAVELLGLNTVNTFIGRDWRQSVEANWPRFLKIWEPIIRFAELHDVRVAIENCAMMYTEDEWPGGKNLAMCPAIWQRMFEDIDSEFFGLNYDPSHPLLLRFDPYKPVRDFSRKLFHIHAKDIQFSEDALNQWGIMGLPKDYHTPRIPGFGELDWGKFIGALMEVGYDGPVCIEVEDPTFGKTLDGRKNAIRVARNVLKPYFP